MPDWEVVVDVTSEYEISAFSAWLNRWRDRVTVSENLGCGCCVDIWQVSGPEAAQSDLVTALATASQSAQPQSPQ